MFDGISLCFFAFVSLFESVCMCLSLSLCENVFVIV